jgi:hypothetical protein
MCTALATWLCHEAQVGAHAPSVPAHKEPLMRQCRVSLFHTCSRQRPQGQLQNLAVSCRSARAPHRMHQLDTWVICIYLRYITC